jgi:N-acetyltransferase
VNPKTQWLRALNDGDNQLILDAGQKKYGAIQCQECLMVYHVKDPEDELIHAGIHEIVNDTLKFTVKYSLIKFFRSWLNFGFS